MAYFEMKNGYIKRLYWSKEKMLNHADKYSQAFSKEATTGKFPKVSFADYEAGNYDPKTEWQYSSFWYKNFDEMAKKTMLRQLLSKHALLSTETIAKAVASDNAVIDENLNPHFEDENIIDGVATEKETPQAIEANTAPTMQDIINEEKQAEKVPVDDFDPMSM